MSGSQLYLDCSKDQVIYPNDISVCLDVASYKASTRDSANYRCTKCVHQKPKDPSQRVIKLAK